MPRPAVSETAPGFGGKRGSATERLGDGFLFGVGRFVDQERRSRWNCRRLDMRPAAAGVSTCRDRLSEPEPSRPGREGRRFIDVVGFGAGPRGASLTGICALFGETIRPVLPPPRRKGGSPRCRRELRFRADPRLKGFAFQRRSDFPPFRTTGKACCPYLDNWAADACPTVRASRAAPDTHPSKNESAECEPVAYEHDALSNPMWSLERT